MCSSYLTPRYIYTGSLWSCTLHYSSGPLSNKTENLNMFIAHKLLICSFTVPVRTKTKVAVSHLIHLTVVTILFMQVGRALQSHKQRTFFFMTLFGTQNTEKENYFEQIKRRVQPVQSLQSRSLICHSHSQHSGSCNLVGTTGNRRSGEKVLSYFVLFIVHIVLY